MSRTGKRHPTQATAQPEDAFLFLEAIARSHAFGVVLDRGIRFNGQGLRITQRILNVMVASLLDRSKKGLCSRDRSSRTASQSACAPLRLVPAVSHSLRPCLCVPLPPPPSAARCSLDSACPTPHRSIQRCATSRAALELHRVARALPRRLVQREAGKSPTTRAIGRRCSAALSLGSAHRSPRLFAPAASLLALPAQRDRTERPSRVS